MRSLCLPAVLAAGLCALPAAAQDKAPVKSDAKPPTLVVRLAALDDLSADAEYLASFTEYENLVTQALGTAKSAIGGIDTKKPLGLYARLADNPLASPVVVLIPISDEAKFRKALEDRSLNPTKDKDDVYSFRVESLQAQGYFRFANGYCYLTALSTEGIAKDKLLAPAQVLGPAGGLASISLRLDQIPDNLKQQALGPINLEITKAVDEAKTEAEKAFAKAAGEEMKKLVSEVVTNGEELNLKLAVDRKANKLTSELSLSSKADTKLSGLISKLGKAESLFGSFGGKDSAVLVLLNLGLPQDVLKSFSALIDQSVSEQLKKETDPKRKALTEKVFKALEPTLKSGELDAAFDLRHPSGAKNYTMVLGGKVKDGAAFDKNLRDVVKDLPADDQKRIKLDAETAGGVKIHMVDTKDLDPKGREAFGDGPAYFAVRGDAAVAVMGENALSVIKEVLGSKPQTSPQVRVSVGLTALAPGLAVDPQYKKEAVEKAAKEAFDKAKDADKVTLVVEGGQTLKVRFEMGTPAIKFFDLMRQAASK